MVGRPSWVHPGQKDVLSRRAACGWPLIVLTFTPNWHTRDALPRLGNIMQYPSMAVAPGVGSGPSTWCGSRYDCTYNNGGGIYTYIIVYTVCIYIYIHMPISQLNSQFYSHGIPIAIALFSHQIPLNPTKHQQTPLKKTTVNSTKSIVKPIKLLGFPRWLVVTGSAVPGQSRQRRLRRERGAHQRCPVAQWDVAHFFSRANVIW